jgi:protein-L-isoaspartate(D-aspartate) O-methyltransferase
MRIQRERMCRFLTERRGICDRRVLEAMAAVPRHSFVREHLRSQAYGDHALPIGEGQTISQPYVVARMTELLDVTPECSVLEIGTGSGYQTAILARLAKRVYSLERIPELARQAIERMRGLGVGNVKIQVFDGTVGWSDVAPFDRIMVTAGAPSAPPSLVEQLAPGGRLLVPEGDRQTQRLTLYQKEGGVLRRSCGEAVVFVPLIGRHGWEDEG